jgi:hypothetical protein
MTKKQEEMRQFTGDFFLVSCQIYNLFVRTLETGRKRAFLACFAAKANKFDI